MKLKKLFAGIVAVAMMATMAAPAFADDDTTPTPDRNKISFSESSVTSVDLTKTYNITNGTAPAETFKFNLSFDSSKTKYGGTKANAVPTKTQYEVDFNQTEAPATLTGKFTINMSELGIKDVGKYYFTISEEQGSKAGVSYDQRVRTLVVSAVNETTGANKELTNNTDLLYYAALYDSEGNKISGADAFSNSYGADVHGLTITKKVRGDFADRNKEFTFKVKLEGTAGKTYVGAEVTVNGGTKQTWAIDGTEREIKLTHNGTCTISNLPDGVTWTVTEDFNDADWSTTVNGSEGVETSATIDKANGSAAFVNKHNGVVDTGVILDNAPYIALLTIVAAGAVVMIMKKRRNYED